LELKQLEAYIKVYELRSFSRAAKELFLSQPSVSVYISSLEEELQTRLIYRSTKEFLPTKSGELFYEYAKDMLSLRDKSLVSLKGLSDCAAGGIRILASSVPAQYILPEMMGAFHKLYPNVVFNMEQADTADVVKGISAHHGDIGFAGAKIVNHKCIYEHLMSEKLILIAPYERYKKVNSTDIPRLLRNEYFVTRESGSGTRLEYEEILKKIGIKPAELKISACLNNTQSIIRAVGKGLGLSFVSELAAKPFIMQKMIARIDIGDMPERSFYIVLNKNCSVTPTSDAFIKFAQSYGREHFRTFMPM
jgi:DNA-binding transcriptional LysR family regulator